MEPIAVQIVVRLANAIGVMEQEDNNYFKTNTPNNYEKKFYELDDLHYDGIRMCEFCCLQKFTDELTYSFSGNTLTLTLYEENLDDVETWVMQRVTK